LPSKFIEFNLSIFVLSSPVASSSAGVSIVGQKMFFVAQCRIFFLFAEVQLTMEPENMMLLEKLKLTKL
jgi:hypothetical protein